MDWWKRLSSQEKLLIGVGAPAVALIALISILRRPEPVEEEDTAPAAPVGLDGPYLTPAGDMGLVGQLAGFEDRISASIIALVESINGANPDEDVPPGMIPSPTQPGTPIPTPTPTPSVGWGLPITPRLPIGDGWRLPTSPAPTSPTPTDRYIRVTDPAPTPTRTITGDLPTITRTTSTWGVQNY